jgi:hypothetical protein
MKPIYIALLVVGGLIAIMVLCVFAVFGLRAINMRNLAEPTTIANTTPDLTLTAIFSPVAPTATLAPLVQTATALPPQAATNTPTHTPLVPVVTETPAAAAPTQTPIAPPATKTPIPTQPPPAKTSTPTRPPVTSTPTRPPVTPTARPGTELVAKPLTSPPNLDGDLSEWNLKWSAKEAVYGADRVFSEDDCSAKFAVAWDQDYLYVAAHVLDQKYVQNATGANLYKGDSLEILFDSKLTADYYDKNLTSDDFQLGISPGSGSPGNNVEAYLWYPSGKKGKPANVVIAAKATADGYDVEVAVPWSLFAITPKANQHYGFVFSVSDDDKSDSQNQESLVSNTATRMLTNPTTWGNLKLGKS